MAHGTKIDGTSYGIKGGKCKVNGTAYSIKNGKTKVGGTAYDINFAKLITYTVDVTANISTEPVRQFTALEGMTWSEFAASSYNSEGRFKTGSEVGHSSYSDYIFYVCTSADLAISTTTSSEGWKLTDEIKNGKTYKPSGKTVTIGNM